MVAAHFLTCGVGVLSICMNLFPVPACGRERHIDSHSTEQDLVCGRKGRDQRRKGKGTSTLSWSGPQNVRRSVLGDVYSSKTTSFVLPHRAVIDTTRLGFSQLVSFSSFSWVGSEMCSVLSNHGYCPLSPYLC